MRFISVPTSASTRKSSVFGSWMTSRKEPSSPSSHSESQDESEVDGPTSAFTGVAEWNTNSQLEICVPKEAPDWVPLFTGKLGDPPTIRRTFSLESIDTCISLMSCSTGVCAGSPDKVDDSARTSKESMDNTLPLTEDSSKWVEFAKKKPGPMDAMMRKESSQVFQHTQMAKPFDLMDDEERTLLYMCCKSNQLKLPSLKKSVSTFNLREPRVVTRNVTSAGCQRIKTGDEVDFRKLHEKTSRKPKGSAHSSGRQISVSRVGLSPQCTPVPAETSKAPQMWSGDSFEADIKQNLSRRAERKIRSSTAALNRVTGNGEDNKQKHIFKRHPEFPKHIAQDYANAPTMPQLLRISPELSHMIRHDIEVRMGQAKHHAIRIQDVKQWDEDQLMDRTYRNLKVFNWLYSLRDQTLDRVVNSKITDIPPGADYYLPAELVHIEACDDPKISPLYAR